MIERRVTLSIGPSFGVHMKNATFPARVSRCSSNFHKAIPFVSQSKASVRNDIRPLTPRTRPWSLMALNSEQSFFGSLAWFANALFRARVQGFLDELWYGSFKQAHYSPATHKLRAEESNFIHSCDCDCELFHSSICYQSGTLSMHTQHKARNENGHSLSDARNCKGSK
jgi:hypothetical protein